MLRPTLRGGALCPPTCNPLHRATLFPIHHSTPCAHIERRIDTTLLGGRLRICCSTSASSSAPSSTAPQPTALYDCVSLGNLCVDVVLQVDELPDGDTEARRALLASLSASPPDVSTWEVGGACNFMIAAARLGMDVGCIGQLGDDQPGHFLRQVLRTEGVPGVEPLLSARQALPQTLLCFVLVSPSGGHVFCSSYDFGPWPLLQGATGIPPPVLQVCQIRQHAVVKTHYHMQTHRCCSVRGRST